MSFSTSDVELCFVCHIVLLPLWLPLLPLSMLGHKVTNIFFAAVSALPHCVSNWSFIHNHHHLQHCYHPCLPPYLPHQPTYQHFSVFHSHGRPHLGHWELCPCLLVDHYLWSIGATCQSHMLYIHSCVTHLIPLILHVVPHVLLSIVQNCIVFVVWPFNLHPHIHSEGNISLHIVSKCNEILCAPVLGTWHATLPSGCMWSSCHSLAILPWLCFLACDLCWMFDIRRSSWQWCLYGLLCAISIQSALAIVMRVGMRINMRMGTVDLWDMWLICGPMPDNRYWQGYWTFPWLRSWRYSLWGHENEDVCIGRQTCFHALFSYHRTLWNSCDNCTLHIQQQ